MIPGPARRARPATAGLAFLDVAIELVDGDTVQPLALHTCAQTRAPGWEKNECKFRKRRLGPTGEQDGHAATGAPKGRGGGGRSAYLLFGGGRAVFRHPGVAAAEAGGHAHRTRSSGRGRARLHLHELLTPPLHIFAHAGSAGTNEVQALLNGASHRPVRRVPALRCAAGPRCLRCGGYLFLTMLKRCRSMNSRHRR
jgi:hypothetical protein